jgi:hypothetical protein
MYRNATKNVGCLQEAVDCAAKCVKEVLQQVAVSALIFRLTEKRMNI